MFQIGLVIQYCLPIYSEYLAVQVINKLCNTRSPDVKGVLTVHDNEWRLY